LCRQYDRPRADRPVLDALLPRGMFGFVEGVIRWNIQVTAYTLTLVPDRYPPFRLAP